MRYWVQTLGISYFSCEEIPNRATPGRDGRGGEGREGRRDGFPLTHNLRVQSIMDMKSWQQEHEAGGLLASAVRKQRHMLVFNLLSPFCLAQDPSLLVAVCLPGAAHGTNAITRRHGTWLGQIPRNCEIPF